MREMQSSPAATLSVVIPTCNRMADLELCLERLMPQFADVGGCEVIVTDDGDLMRTKTALAAKFPAVIWTQGPRRGAASNRNHGASSANGDWLIFVDDDIVPDRQFLCAYLQAIASVGDDKTALEGSTLRERELPSLLWEAPHNPDGGILISCNIAISKANFFSAGAFDARFPLGSYFEDTEFAARILAKGFETHFVPEAKVVHPLRKRPNSRKLALRWQGNAIYAFDQGASAHRVLWNLPWHALRVIQSRFRGQRLDAENIKAMSLFAAEWLWVLWFTPGWVMKWSTRERSPFWS